jgi:hypothetical protein
MATINPERLKANITAIVKKVLEAQSKAVTTAMFDLQADMIRRVFDAGVDSQGVEIGKYSTKPMYYSVTKKNSQIRSSSLKGKGKFSNSPKFANGNKRKSQYFPGGYSEFRSTVGRQNSKVDLRLTGSLLRSIQVGVGSNKVSLGFNNDIQFEKAKGNEQRFNKTIFAPSISEIEAIEQKWQEDVEDAFFDSFK